MEFNNEKKGRVNQIGFKGIYPYFSSTATGWFDPAKIINKTEFKMKKFAMLSTIAMLIFTAGSIFAQTAAMKSQIANYEFKDETPLDNSIKDSPLEALKAYSVNVEDCKAIFNGNPENQLLLDKASEAFNANKPWTFMIEGNVSDLEKKVMFIASLADGSLIANRFFEITYSNKLFLARICGDGGKNLVGFSNGLKAENDGSFQIAISYNAENKSALLFINGKENEKNKLSIPATLNPKEPLRLGMFRSGFGPFSGSIKNIRIYNYAMTSEEINNIWPAKK